MSQNRQPVTSVFRDFPKISIFLLTTDNRFSEDVGQGTGPQAAGKAAAGKSVTQEHLGRSALTVGFSDIAESTIRVIGVRRATYVEFEYSLADELLVVELVMPYPAFDEFCAINKARMLAPKPDAAAAFAELAARHSPSTTDGRSSLA